MADDLYSGLAAMLMPDPELTVWEWAEKEIEFRKPYPAMADGPYDSELTPFWREPMERFADRNIREIWLIKPPQAGASENVLLMPMRYAVCMAPQTILYVSGDMKGTEEFMRERIEPGLKLSPTLRERFADARPLEHAIYYPDMMIVAGWSQAASIAKQRPVDAILADEVAIWPGFTADQLRRRLGTRPFSKIVGISSLSPKDKRPTRNQPIWIEFQQTDRRFYFLPDPGKRNPKTGQWFRLEMGFRDRKSGKESPFGLKWSPDARRADGTWDMNAVRESAYYKTPWGTVITDEMKRELLLRGQWRPTRSGADPTKWGGHLCDLYLPWLTWGHLARKFLEAVAKYQEQGDKTALKVVVCEDLGQEWWDERTQIEDDAIVERSAEYARGTRFTESDGIANDKGQTFAQVYEPFHIPKRRLILTTADVQKGYGYHLTREWVANGDSGLIDWGEWHTWRQLNQIANERKANRVLVDSGYAERQQETYQACKEYRFIPTAGNENISNLLFVENRINPFEGTRRHNKNMPRSARIVLILFRTFPLKGQLAARIEGGTQYAWHVYHDIEREYVEQMTAEEYIDGKWIAHGANHLWDCEVLQLLGATRFGFNQFRAQDMAEPE